MNVTFPKILKKIFLLLAFIFSIAPFLYLARFNHPSSDDYCYSSKTSFLGFAATQADHWFTWSGRYTATALLSILSLENISLLGYRLIPLILILIFSAAIYVFLKALFSKTTTYDICALGFVIIFLYFFKAPNITEAFYWLAGSVTYQVASILSLFLFALILHLLRKKRESKSLYTVIGSLLGILIVGLNEISLIYLCITLFLLVVVRFYAKRKLDWDLILIVSLTYLAAGISLTAPGNSMRMATIQVEQFNLNYSISESLKMAFDAVKSWAPVLGLLVIIFVNSFKRIALQLQKDYNFKKLSWVWIIFSIIALYLLVVIGYFPTFWSQGWEPPTRTINVILLVFIAGGMGIFLLSLILLEKRLQFIIKIPIYIKIVSVFVLVGYISFLTNNIENAYNDIFSGKAVVYDLKMQERYKLLDNCEVGLCDIPLRLTDYPPTIFAYELALKQSDEIYYYNKCLMDYIHNTYTPPERKLREEK